MRKCLDELSESIGYENVFNTRRIWAVFCRQHFRCVFLNKNFLIWNHISLNFVPTIHIDKTGSDGLTSLRELLMDHFNCACIGHQVSITTSIWNFMVASHYLSNDGQFTHAYMYMCLYFAHFARRMLAGVRLLIARNTWSFKLSRIDSVFSKWFRCHYEILLFGKYKISQQMWSL